MREGAGNVVSYDIVLAGDMLRIDADRGANLHRRKNSEEGAAHNGSSSGGPLQAAQRGHAVRLEQGNRMSAGREVRDLLGGDDGSGVHEDDDRELQGNRARLGIVTFKQVALGGPSPELQERRKGIRKGRGDGGHRLGGRAASRPSAGEGSDRGSLPDPRRNRPRQRNEKKSSSRRVVPGVTSTRRARKEKPEITVVSRDDRRHRCGRAEKTQSTERQGEVGTSGCRSRSLATVCVSLFRN